jgi:transcriptional regulator with XRE-family HTH domain
MQTPPLQELLTRDEGLAARLKRARGEMLAKELAEKAGWPQSKISKIEGGKQLPSREDLSAWAGFTLATGETLEIWNAMLTEALQARRDWAQQFRDGQVGVQSKYNALIARCTTFSYLETTYIPRFFQVPGYTRAVLAETHQRHGGIDDIDAAVAVRQASTGYLYDLNRHFDLLITEPVLRWRPRALPMNVVRQQLDRLLTIDGLENVRFGILPLDRPIRYFPQNSVELFDDTGYIEDWFVERQLLDDEVVQYRALIAELWEDAVQGEEAREMIQKILSTVH